MVKFFVLVFLVTALVIQESAGLKCYTCSVTEDDSDTSCATDPGSIKVGGVTDCDKKYCIIVRVDYKDPRGKLASMVRNCVDKPTYVNEIVEDETHRAYYRSCRTDLCNTGSGRSDSSNDENGAFGDKSTIYVPGTGASGSVLVTASLSTMLLAYIFIHFIR